MILYRHLTSGNLSGKVGKQWTSPTQAEVETARWQPPKREILITQFVDQIDSKCLGFPNFFGSDIVQRITLDIWKARPRKHGAL